MASADRDALVALYHVTSGPSVTRTRAKLDHRYRPQEAKSATDQGRGLELRFALPATTSEEFLALSDVDYNPL